MAIAPTCGAANGRDEPRAALVLIGYALFFEETRRRAYAFCAAKFRRSGGAWHCAGWRVARLPPDRI